MNEFMHLCRICLNVENVMINIFDRMENFDVSISELLYEYVQIKINIDDVDPKLICEDCASELAFVANFHDKCKLATETLEQLKATTAARPTTLSVEIVDSNALKTEQLIIEDHEEEYIGSSHDTENESHIKDEPKTNAHYGYVLFDDNVTSYRRDDGVVANDNAAITGTDDNNIIEEIDDMCVVTEYLNSDTEELMNYNQNDNANHHAERRCFGMDNQQLTMKININHCCKICGAGFAQLSNLTKHLTTHTNPAPDDVVACGTCNMIFDDVNELSLHMEEQKCAMKPTMVNVPKTKEARRRERRSKNKNHICTYCQKGFSSSSLLVTHIRVHTGEKPFPCEICGKKFATQGGLDLHMRRHRGDKPYQCKECDKCFAESSNLKVHMRTHTGEKPHKCTRCGRSFSRVFLLQIHQRTHTGERPYACEVCTKSFAQQGDLASHKRIHSGERPHVCKICTKGFIKSSGLTMHMKRHGKFQVLHHEDVITTPMRYNDEAGEDDDNVYALMDGMNDNL